MSEDYRYRLDIEKNMMLLELEHIKLGPYDSLALKFPEPRIAKGLHFPHSRTQEERVKALVKYWLMFEAEMLVMPGTDPPDFFATNITKIIGVESISYHWDMHGFEVSSESLKFPAGQIFFVIAVQTMPIADERLHPCSNEKGMLYRYLDAYEPFVLSWEEMWARKGESKRGSRYGRSIPRTPEGWEAKGWEPFRRAWDKMGE